MLCQHFGLPERFWMNLQSRNELEMVKDRLRGKLEQEGLTAESCFAGADDGLGAVDYL
jgi:plasmid maintenance system antidote protein VapI